MLDDTAKLLHYLHYTLTKTKREKSEMGPSRSDDCPKIRVCPNIQVALDGLFVKIEEPCANKIRLHNPRTRARFVSQVRSSLALLLSWNVLSLCRDLQHPRDSAKGSRAALDSSSEADTPVRSSAMATSDRIRDKRHITTDALRLPFGEVSTTIMSLPQISRCSKNTSAVAVMAYHLLVRC